jgi:hypothetical protein
MPHARNFAVDERVIEYGVNYFSSLLVERLGLWLACCCSSRVSWRRYKNKGNPKDTPTQRVVTMARPAAYFQPGHKLRKRQGGAQHAENQIYMFE